MSVRPRPRSARLCVLLVAALACSQVEAGRAPGTSKGPPTEHPAADGAVEPERIVLALDESATVGNLRLRWVDIEDSRCPVGAECVWAGRVVVTLEVSTDSGEAGWVRLASDQRGRPEEENELMERLTLIEVEPYPRHGQVTKRSRYRAMLEVRPAS